MDLTDFLTDERFLANILGTGLLLVGIAMTAIVIRQVLKHGGDKFASWTGLHWLDGLSKEASRNARNLLFWSTLGLGVAGVVGMGIYHGTGLDVRHDLRDWFRHLTVRDVFLLGVLVGKLLVLAAAIGITIRLVRRLRAFLESHVLRELPRVLSAYLADEDEPAAAEGAAPTQHEDNIQRWFYILERFVLVSIFLSGVWLGGKIVGFTLLDDWCGLLLRILAIATGARLLTLSCKTFSTYLTEMGNRHLSNGQFRRYWERVTRLFPFGERCFEAAVYVSATSLCMHELEFIKFVAHYGARAVTCIAIFFCTRVIIELLTVFLNDAFGLYEESRALDQKELTLVPLLLSGCQYALYFGSALMMLGVFEVNTTPILAGAGIIGLAGGLGAQSLVTDVVSGFFILFENQYLVGDIVQIGDAMGRVEAVSIRHTQVRDEQGKLFIVPNGQIKTVINYSKGYVNAVVDVKVPTSMNLEQVTGQMAEAGRRLRQARREVIGETMIKGLVDLTPSEMVVRAVTKVQPGAHVAMQLEYRRILRGVFEEGQAHPTLAA